MKEYITIYKMHAKKKIAYIYIYTYIPEMLSTPTV